MEISDVKQHIKTGNFVVYMHRCPNGKVYIGTTSAIKPSNRWGRNGRSYHGNTAFYADIQKYGWDNIEHTILADNLTKDIACNMEYSLIQHYKNEHPDMLYNVMPGGKVHNGFIITDEHKHKIGEAHKGKYVELDSRKKMSESHKGKKMTEEFKRKESLARMGSGNQFYGKHHSEETKARLREISKVKCAGKNNGMYGKKHSEETKRKIGEKSKGRIPWNKGKKYTIKEISNHGDSRCQADD